MMGLMSRPKPQRDDIYRLLPMLGPLCNLKEWLKTLKGSVVNTHASPLFQCELLIKIKQVIFLEKS